ILGGDTNMAVGFNSIVLGGVLNQTLGDYSLAAGTRAKANSKGCFTWGDSTSADISCTTPALASGVLNADNRFVVRATGGVYLNVDKNNLNSFVKLDPGAPTWANGSDRNIKHDIVKVDAKAVLEKLDSFPISTWRYNGEVSGALHMGPMAQDFYAAY